MTAQTTSLWGHAGFLRLWAAQTVSSFGARIAREGLPIIAVKALGAHPFGLGVLASLGLAGYGLVGAVAGALADRLPRRALLIGADLGRAAVMLAIPLIAVFGRLTFAEVCIAMALMSALTVVFDTADHAFLPGLVGPGQLVDANSRLGATEAVAEVGGPALAGILFQTLTAPIAVAVTAATYLVSAAFLTGVPPSPPSPRDTAATFHLDLTSGLRRVLAHPAVRPLWLTAVSRDFFGWFFGALYTFYALNVLKLGVAMLGLTIAMGGLGGLIGAPAAPWLSRRLGPGPTIVLAGFGAGLTAFLTPLAGGPVIAATAMLMLGQLVGDALQTISQIGATSLRQSAFPPAALGRTSGAFALGQGLAGVAGALTGGALGALLGPRETLYLAAAGLTAAPLFGLASPLWRVRGAASDPS